MKLLLFSDLHCDTHAARNLVARSQDCDLAVCAGDLANTRRHLALCLDVLREISCPLVLVPGNNESFDELQSACRGWESAHVLHGSGWEFRGIPVYGLGGAVPVTPFGDWSFDLTEQQAERMLADCPAGAILVSHSPPQGLLDVSSQGKHLGSTSVRAVIDRLKPRLVVCGHIHAMGGRQTLHGTTTVINAGPAGVEFLLEDSPKG